MFFPSVFGGREWEVVWIGGWEVGGSSDFNIPPTRSYKDEPSL